MHARYSIDQDAPDLLLIRDVGPWDKHKTITNDAEHVVKELVTRLNGRRLEYIDTEGAQAEIRIINGQFAGFATTVIHGDLGGRRMEVTTIDPRGTVICDWCDEFWTDSPVSGGFLFQSKATCPKCASRIESEAIKFGEQHFIRARCPAGQSFADWMRSIR